VTEYQGDPSLAAYYSDPDLLRQRQGGDAGGSVAAEFADWVVDLIDPGRFSSVLDAGAGVGRFTTRVAERMKPGTSLVAVDLFAGMVDGLRSIDYPGEVDVHVVRANIENLPFDDASFDLIMANHVLYHVATLPIALSRLAGMLTAAGTFLATTNADNAVVPILELHRRVCRELGETVTPDVSSFSSENGADVLRRHFPTVDAHTFRKPPVPIEPEDLLRGYRSTGRYRLLSQTFSSARVDEVAQRVTDVWIREDVVILGEVHMSAFVCRK